MHRSIVVAATFLCALFIHSIAESPDAESVEVVEAASAATVQTWDHHYRPPSYRHRYKRPYPGPQPPPGPTPELVLGVAQVESVYWDLDATITKLVGVIEAAGAAGVNLLTFPEGFLSGYPWFNYWARTFTLRANEKAGELFMLNSPRVGFPELGRIQAAAAAAKVNLALAINERDNSGSNSAVFNALVFITSEGKVVARHRKVLPSFTERFWWTHGDGSDLLVVDMPGVGKVCGALCWENFVLLARYTMFAQGCEFYVAPTQDLGPWWAAHMKATAREGRMYVMAMGQVSRPEVAAETSLAMASTAEGSDWPAASVADAQKLWSFKPNMKPYLMDGGGIIADPDGKTIAGPVYSGCSWCEPECDGVAPGSVKWANMGCPGMDSGGQCGVVSIPGLTEAEFILTAPARRSTALARKPLSENFGDAAPRDIWRVTWFNRPTQYITTTSDASATSGRQPLYVDKPGCRDQPTTAQCATWNGLFPADRS